MLVYKLADTYLRDVNVMRVLLIRFLCGFPHSGHSMACVTPFALVELKNQHVFVIEMYFFLPVVHFYLTCHIICISVSALITDN